MTVRVTAFGFAVVLGIGCIAAGCSAGAGNQVGSQQDLLADGPGLDVGIDAIVDQSTFDGTPLDQRVDADQKGDLSADAVDILAVCPCRT